MNTEESNLFPIDAFMEDMYQLADENPFLALGLLNDHVEMVTAPVESLTVYGNKVQHPQRYIDLIKDLKEYAIKKIVKDNLALVQKYINDHSDTKEAEFLSGLMNRINKDSIPADYYEILDLAKNAIQNVAPQPKRRFLSWTDKNKQNDFLLACNQMVRCMEHLMGECLMFEYPANAKGEINTSAFDAWVNANFLNASAIYSPGSTINDITRNVKIGDKSIYALDIQVLEEDAKMHTVAEKKLNDLLVKINDPNMIKAAAELLAVSPDEVNKGKVKLMDLKNLIKKLPIKGNSKAKEFVDIIIENFFNEREALAHEAGYIIPGHFEKKRLIQILRALDNGLLLGDACAALYREYEGVDDLCQRLIVANPSFAKELNEIAQAAKKLLLAHSRDYVELIKIDGNFKPKEPQNIINQVKDAQEIFRKNLSKLQEINGVTDLEQLFLKLLHERADVVKKYPEKVAVKEELLSVKQNVQNNLYLMQVMDSFTLDGNAISPAASESQNIAIMFDGKGGAFIQVEVQQSVFIAKAGMIALNPQGELFELATPEDPRQPNLLTTHLQVHFTAAEEVGTNKNIVPKVNVSLKKLKFTRATYALEFDPKMSKVVEEKVELVSQSSLNSSR